MSGGESRRRLEDYLKVQTSRGERYFKARQIADALGMSPKEVGVNMKILQTQSPHLDIEAWSYSRSTTWKVGLAPNGQNGENGHAP